MVHGALRRALAIAQLIAIAFLLLSLASFDVADPPSLDVHPPADPPHNLGGPIGAHLSHALLSCFGWWATLVLAWTALVGGICQWLGRRVMRARWSWLGLPLLCLSASIGNQFLAPTALPSPAVGGGGYLGALGLSLLREQFGPGGFTLILGTSTLTGLILCRELLLSRVLWLGIQAIRLVLLRMLGVRARLDHGWDDPEELDGPAPRATLQIHPQGSHGGAIESNHRAPALAEPRRSPAGQLGGPSGASSATPSTLPARTSAPPARPASSPAQATRETANTNNYELPPTETLDPPVPRNNSEFDAKLHERAELLEKTLFEYGYQVRVVQIDTGPVITQFEIELEAGLRVSKIVGLSHDLAIALAVPNVRIVAPIPGKTTVGIEVPNDKRAIVRLSDVMGHADERTKKFQIPLFLGQDVRGSALAFDLSKMPHLLIAGRTGTGKSVCLNAMILSILMTRTPDQIKLILIDPKMVELSQFKKIPHLMHPVVTDMKKAESILSWACDHMDERYSLLSKVGARNIQQYNQMSPEEIYAKLDMADPAEQERIPSRLPQIVIIADEMADLMMTAAKEVETHIVRLAQKARAVGIHLIIATQRPTVDVITGLIKGNLPARIAFQVASKNDSRVVLDEMGADKLLGNGDMLFLVPGTSHLVRAQGTYVSDREIEEVCRFLERYPVEFDRDLVKRQAAGGADGDDPLSRLKERDDLYPQAVEVVVREQRGSTSLLQKALGIGYGRASRMIDFMAEDGIVGEYKSGKHREVLYTWEEWLEMQGTPEPDGVDDDSAMLALEADS